MSSLRLSLIGALLLAALGIGFIALTLNQPKPVVALQSQAVPAPLTLNYLVAAHALPAGTLAREADFTAHSVPADQLPSAAIIDTPDARAGLRGSLVRNYIDTGSPVTQADLLRPRDRGFLASVLEPGTRAVSIGVDAVTGVSGMIWPGDRVDVVLTQEIEEKSGRRMTASEAVLSNARVIAIDQEMVQGAPVSGDVTGKVARTVTLQVAPPEVQRITVAQQLGKLALTIRSAEDQANNSQPYVTLGTDVSHTLGNTVKVYLGDKVQEYSFR